MAVCAECGKKMGFFAKAVDGAYCSSSCASKAVAPPPSGDPALFEALRAFQKRWLLSPSETLDPGSTGEGYWVLPFTAGGQAPAICPACGAPPARWIELTERQTWTSSSVHERKRHELLQGIRVGFCAAHSPSLLISRFVEPSIGAALSARPKASERAVALDAAGTLCFLDGEIDAAHAAVESTASTASPRMFPANLYVYDGPERSVLLFGILTSLHLQDGAHFVPVSEPASEPPTSQWILVAPSYEWGRALLATAPDPSAFFFRAHGAVERGEMRSTLTALRARLGTSLDPDPPTCPFCGGPFVQRLSRYEFRCDGCGALVLNRWFEGSAPPRFVVLP